MSRTLLPPLPSPAIPEAAAAGGGVAISHY